jgi:hypothetical protein
MEPDRTPVAYDFPVELGKVREFARAVKARADHREIVPPMFPATAVTWSDIYLDQLAELTARGTVLHIEQEFTFPQGPPAVGSVLRAVESLESVRTRAGKRGWVMETRVLRTEFCDQAGVLVGCSRATIVVTGKSAEQS